jgi:hypothetical protein
LKLRIMRSAPNEENLFLLPDRFWKSELFRKSIQPFDLMSRRHPLSSTRAFRCSSGARVTCRHQSAGNFQRSELTSSSWRPCGSSSQSSSLRSSPSSPSSLSWPCCPPNVEMMTLVAACTRESKCTASRIHQHVQKNSVPLKEVLTSRSESVRSNDIGDTSTRSHADAKNAATINVDTCQYCRKRLCRSAFLNCAIDERDSIDVVATHRECQNDACTDSESQALAIKKFFS